VNIKREHEIHLKQIKTDYQLLLDNMQNSLLKAGLSYEEALVSETVFYLWGDAKYIYNTVNLKDFEKFMYRIIKENKKGHEHIKNYMYIINTFL